MTDDTRPSWGPPAGGPPGWGPPGPPGGYGPPSGSAPPPYGGPGGQPGWGPAPSGPVPGWEQPPAGPPVGYGPPTGPGPGPGPGGYGAGGYGVSGYGVPGPDPQYGPPAYGPGDMVTIGAAPPPRRRRGRALWAGIAAGTAVALTAGGVYAYTALSGGGAVLAARAPADAVAYAELNLDPPAGQKVAALRFFRHFPDLKVGGDEGTLVESLLEPLITDSEVRQQFVRSIKPWLGDHAAMAVDPQDGKPQPVLLVETTDAAATRAGLDRINAEQDPDDKLGFVLDGDLVVVAETQAIAETAHRDAGAGSLADSDTFTSDMEDVGGDDAIVTAWSDLAAAGKLSSREGSSEAKGRLAARLRFTDTSAELVVRTVGNPARAGADAVGKRLGTLPEDTAAAVAVSGGDELVRQAYRQAEAAGLGRTLRRLEEDTGLDLPDDVAAMVGSSTVLAVGGGTDDPQVGLVAKTGDPERARVAAEKVFRELGVGQSVTARSTADGSVIASSSAYADRLTAEGKLGSTELVRSALPDLDKAQLAVYVDARRLAEVVGEPLPEEARALRAVGLTATSSGDVSTVRVRVVVG